MPRKRPTPTPVKKTTCMMLSSIPADIRCILLQEQGKIKSARNIGQFSLEQTIYSIIREHRRCEAQNVKNVA